MSLSISNSSKKNIYQINLKFNKGRYCVEGTGADNVEQYLDCLKDPINNCFIGTICT